MKVLGHTFLVNVGNSVKFWMVLGENLVVEMKYFSVKLQEATL